jgi:hypothetical protein
MTAPTDFVSETSIAKHVWPAWLMQAAIMMATTLLRQVLYSNQQAQLQQCNLSMLQH